MLGCFCFMCQVSLYFRVTALDIASRAGGSNKGDGNIGWGVRDGKEGRGRKGKGGGKGEGNDVKVWYRRKSEEEMEMAEGGWGEKMYSNVKMRLYRKRKL